MNVRKVHNSSNGYQAMVSLTSLLFRTSDVLNLHKNYLLLHYFNLEVELPENITS